MTQTITLKTLDKKQYVFDGDFNTVEDLMVRIENDLNHPKDCQQLIYAGKILNSVDNIPDMNEKSFLVLLIKKTRKKEPIPENTTENTESTESSTEILSEEPTENTSENTESKESSTEILSEEPTENTSENTESLETSTEETTQESENTSPQGDSQENIPENPAGNSNFINSVVPDDNMIQNLVSMGFEVENVKLALQISNNNLDVASQILSEPGMLEHLQSQIENGMNPFSNNPNSQQITEEQVLQMMEQNPQVFQQLLSGLCQQQPEIANLVQNDPQSFISFLTQVINQSGIGSSFNNPLPNEINENIENNLPIEEDTRQLSEHIQMTEEEHLNMESLIQMFPHIPQVTILETLRACSNDQTATANLLFEY